MAFQIIRNDITNMHVDAIVNPTNSELIGTGATDGSVHRVGGKGLDEECARIGYCAPGDAVLTGGYLLPCRYVIHTVGPIWEGGNEGEADTLRSCYRKSLALAKEYKCKSVAFPLIAAGSFGFPRENALQIANQEIRSFLKTNDMEITLVVFDSATTLISEKLYNTLFNEIASKIDDQYVLEQKQENYRHFHTGIGHAADGTSLRERNLNQQGFLALQDLLCEASSVEESPIEKLPDRKPTPEELMGLNRRKKLTLEESVAQSRSGFSATLLHMIDQKGMRDPDFYNAANLRKQHFSKIKSHPDYRPTRETVLACTIALKLTTEEAEKLMRSAGFTFSDSLISDIIVQFFIRNKDYDIDSVNDSLFEFGQKILGCKS